VQIVNDKNAVPVCPHCDREMETIVRVEDSKGLFQGHYGYCYICPHCRRVLGFSDYST
jgi:hypothetical protein